MTQTRRPHPLPYASFPELFLILLNLIVGWREGVIKRGLVFHIKSIDLEAVLNVGESRIHQIHQCKVGII